MHWMLMPLRRYAEFSGRSRRKEYWMFVLGMVLLYLVLVFLMIGMMGSAFLGAVGGAASADASGDGAATAGMMGALLGGGIVGILIALIWLALLIPTIALGIRRLHDIDRTGWWMMLGYGPYILSVILTIAGSVELGAILNIVSMIGFLVLLVFAVTAGTKGPNRFGPDPKGEDLGQVFA